MEVPSPNEGTVSAVSVKIGDKVSQGSAIVTLASDEAVPAPAAAAPPAVAPAAGVSAGAPTPPGAGRAPSERESAENETAESAPPEGQNGRVHASPGDPAPRARVRRSARRLARLRTARAHHERRCPSVRQERPRGCTPCRTRRAAGVRRHRALAEDRFRAVRPDRNEAALADQEDLRPGAASQLGDDPARDEPRRCGYHGARSVPVATECGECEVRRQADAARVPDRRRGRGAAEVPRVQRVARRREPRAQTVLPYRVRGRHAERARRPGREKCRCEGDLRDRRGDGRARREGARRKARARGYGGRNVHDLEPRRHRRNVVHADHQRARRSRFSASRAPRCGRFGTVPRLRRA